MERDPDFWEVTWKFDGDEFAALRKLAEEQTFSAQQNIFEQGDAADDTPAPAGGSRVWH